MRDRYDFLIVGAGLYGCVSAQRLAEKGKTVLVIDKRNHIGGNCATDTVDGIIKHKYGPHIFHTNNRAVWEYLNRFTEVHSFVNSPIAISGGEVYSLPFNMYTFNKLFGIVTPREAREFLEEQTAPYSKGNPCNLEEKALSLVGPTIYKKLIKGYTEKQWGRPCKELSPEIIKRLPVRFTYDNNYFDCLFQGVPNYVRLFNNLLKDKNIDVKLGIHFEAVRKEAESLASKIIYTGSIDEYFGYDKGYLEYRSLEFVDSKVGVQSYQGNAVVNYTDSEHPWTRIIEHKHFYPHMDLQLRKKCTIITKEYPITWTPLHERFYPINDAKNNELYDLYSLRTPPNVIFGGRLGEYHYRDMDGIISDALYMVDHDALK